MQWGFIWGIGISLWGMTNSHLGIGMGQLGIGNGVWYKWEFYTIQEL